MKCFLPFLLCAWFCPVFAQVTQADFSNGVPPELKRISKKLIIASREGRVPCYISDSLNRLANTEEILSTGTVLTYGQKQNWRNPGDITDLIDTAWYEVFSRDSILSNLGFNYAVEGKFDPAMRLEAVAPLYFRTINTVEFSVPLFWVKVSDLPKVLSSVEQQFIQSYSWFLAFVPIAIHKDQIEVIWHYAGAYKRLIYSETENYNSLLVGSSLVNVLRYLPFVQYSAGKLQLFENGQPVKRDTFFMRHNGRIQPPAEGKWYPCNPSNLGDTVLFFDSPIFEPPLRFDSFQIVNLAGVTTIQYFQRNMRSQTLKYNRYECTLEATKEFLYPAAWTLITSLIKLKED